MSTMPTIPSLPDMKRKDLQIGARKTIRCYHCKGAIDSNQDEEILQANMYNVNIGGVLRYYHPEHFACEKCEKHIPQTEDFVAENNQLIVCLDCYITFYSKKCQTCSQPITGHYREVLEFGCYHEPCFSCHECQKLIGDDTFYIEGGIVCENCFTTLT